MPCWVRTNYFATLRSTAPTLDSMSAVVFASSWQPADRCAGRRRRGRRADGVAGGELLVPVITVLFAVDVKLAGSLSLLVLLPTMLVGFARYSRSQAFSVLRDNGRFTAAVAAGLLAGAVAGGLLLGVVPEAMLVPAVVLLLLISAVKVWRHA